ncbi:hypothetical protein NY08_1974 [Rhodococcus sp. B7740]|nr:hypothetical protein NY08_1974 [Rhodococcus sp. B7740]
MRHPRRSPSGTTAHFDADHVFPFTAVTVSSVKDNARERPAFPDGSVLLCSQVVE